MKHSTNAGKYVHMAEDCKHLKRAPVTMQISVTDRDYACAKHVIPHQLRTLGIHANEVLISVNRYEKGTDTQPLNNLLSQLSQDFDNIRIEEVAYCGKSRQWISETFFDGRDYPLFDYNGSPIHAFIEPFIKARNPYLFRLECDMLLGGAGPWFSEATEVLENHADVIAVNPLAGPRKPDTNYHSGGTSFPVPTGEAFKVDLFTTRTHLIKTDSFCQAMSGLDQTAPKRLKHRVYTRVAGYPMADHLEILFQNKMREKGMLRADVGGFGKLWTLHPVHKTTQVISQLPRLIDMVESSNLPEIQYGLYDLHPGVLGETDRPVRMAEIKRLGTLAKSRLSSGRKPDILRSDFFEQSKS